MRQKHRFSPLAEPGSSQHHGLDYKSKYQQSFIVGDLDIVYHMPGTKEYIHNGGFKKDVPNLQDVVVMEGVAHFINQVKPEEINAHIYDFVKKF